VTLVSVQECMDYCRVQTDDEEALFTRWRASAYGSVQTFLRRPIIAEERTFRLHQGRTCHTGAIILPIYPASPLTEDSDGYEVIPAAVLRDADDAIVPDTDYHFDERIAVFTAVTGVTFSTYPYTVVATVGLSAHPDYATIIEPIINTAILDLVADKWANRNPNATNESEGGGVSTSYDQVGIPKRVRDELDPWRMVRAL
jgi:hypothetical protein